MTVFGGALQPDGSHLLPVRVYFEDTDFSGNVYHAAYLKFLERGRTEYLRALDLHHSRLIEEGLVFAVSRLEIDYLRPARIDDVLEIATRPGEVGGARLLLDQTISRGDEPLCRARVTAVLLNAAGRPVRLPQPLRSLFVPD